MTADCSGWWLLKIEGLWKFLKVRQQWSLPHQQTSFHKWFIRSIQSSFITFNPQLNFFQNWSQSSLTLPLPYQLRLHFSSVAQSCPPLCYPMDCSTPGFPVHHNSRSLIKLMSSRWCHPTISSPAIPFSSCLQSFPASGSFVMSWLFASGGQNRYFYKTGL